MRDKIWFMMLLLGLVAIVVALAVIGHSFSRPLFRDLASGRYGAADLSAKDNWFFFRN